jgi:LuxR family maltose regulon positive regulatory protein
MAGHADKARHVTYAALSDDETDGSTYTARLLLTLCFVDWLEGDLSGVQQQASRLLQLGNNHGLMESKTFGDYHLGMVHYYRANAETAQAHLAQAAKNGRLVDPNTYIHANCALALSFQTSGQPDKSNAIARELVEYALQAKNTDLLSTADALTAELALRQERLDAAAKWARESTPEPPKQAMRFFVPLFTRARILIAQATPTQRRCARNLLEQQNEFYLSVHNTHCLIEILALKAVLHAAEDHQQKALTDLGEALTLAHHSRRIRPFLDYGPQMSGLLQHINRQDRFGDYIDEIRSAIDRQDKPEHQSIVLSQASPPTLPNAEGVSPLQAPLTNRELDIVKLLVLRLSNKEIAGKLFISPDTVKRHAVNLYKKLSVSSRQQAVKRAYELGILSE